jgi:hypothetical protein
VRVRSGELKGWVAVRYERDGEVLEGTFNLAPEERVVPLDETRGWSLLLSSDAPGYGGSGKAALEQQGLRLPGLTAALLRGAAA